EQRELGMGDRETDRRGLCGSVVRRFEWLHQVPRDDPARQPPPGEPGDALGDGLGADPAEQTPEADVCADQAKLPVDLGELQIVHAHDLGAVRVDDLLVQQVTGEAKCLGRKLRIGGRLKAVAKTEMTDLLREIAPAHDLLPGRRREDGPLRGRELPLRHDRDVRELAHLVTVRLDHPAVLYLRQVRHDAASVTGTIRISQSARPGVPSRVGGSPVPQMTDAGLRARALADQATAAALDADWPRAAELNQKLVDTSPDDLEARNRLGRALIELGRLDEAKVAFAEVLKTEPYNSIALRGNARVAALQEHKVKPSTTTTKTQPPLFIEDMGKTGILRLINPAPTHVLAKYSPGAECDLREQ